MSAQDTNKVVLRFNTDTVNSFKTDLSIANGYEDNVFKSTSRYFDKSIGKYLPKDSLITSGMFGFGEADISYTINRKRSYFDIGAQGWCRYYYSNTALNQTHSKASGEFGYFITPKIIVGIQNKLSYSDKISISTAGDEYASKYKYIDNQTALFSEYEYNKQNTFTIEGTLSNKKYLKENTDYSLSNNTVELDLKYKKRVAKKHVFYTYVKTAQRSYVSYLALNEDGTSDSANPIRVYRYFDVGFKLRYKATKHVLFYPSIEYSKRNDIYKDYYSYAEYYAGIDSKLSFKNFLLFAGIDVKQRKYDMKQAPSFSQDDKLCYTYLHTKFKAEYVYRKKLTLFVQAETDSRHTNTKLEYYKTLRSYNQFELLTGLTYTLDK